MLTVSPSVISAKVSDPDGIDGSSIILQVDGEQKLHTYDAVTGLVSWIPPTYPKNDTWHNVKLEVKDNRGEGASKSWTFLVFDDDPIGPRVTSLTPSEGTTARNTATISAKITDYNGINSSSCKLTANGKPLPFTYTATNTSSGTVTASLNGLHSGNYTFNLTIKDNLGNSTTSTWSFTVENCVNAVYFGPTGSVPVSSNFNIYVHWEDNLNHDMSTSFQFIEVIDPDGIKKIYNGTTSPAVNANYSYYDTGCGGYIVYNQLDEGINLNITNTGTYTVTAKARDTLGNESTKTWTFFAGIPPEITQQSPADASVYQDFPPSTISAKVYDAEGIDPNCIKLTIDNYYGYNPVVKNHSYDPATGIVSWDSSSLVPSSLPYNVILEAKDINGVPASSSWRFTVKNNPPVIDQQTPTNWSSSQTSPPVISARVSDKQGINASSIRLTVAGVVRTHAFDPFTGIVSWVPDTPFAQSASAYPVKLEVKDALGLYTKSEWYFIVFGGPQLTGYSPQGDTYTHQPEISASFTDPFSLGDPAYLKVDGQNVPIGIDYPIIGYEPDGCSMQPVFDYKQATVRANPPLIDGPHTAEVKITNNLGMSKTHSWSFNVKAGPKITDYPADYSVINNQREIKFKIVDPNDQVNPASIVITGWAANALPYTYDAQTGQVIVTIPDPFIEGQQSININASDMNGNTATKSIRLYIITDPPQFRFEGEGKTFYAGEPLDLQVDMKSFRTHIVRDKCSLKIDGAPVEAFISVDNKDMRAKSVWWGYAYCDNERKTAVGFMRYQGTPELSPGIHELTATATDAYGNTNTQTWQFKVEDTAISDVKPQGIVVDANPTVEATVYSAQVALNKQTIRLVIDKAAVHPQITEENGLIKVTYTSEALADGEYHNVTLSVNDANHFRHTKSWRFKASSNQYPTGLSKPTPADGAINYGGITPITVTANNIDGTMDLTNAKMTFTHLTTNSTFQGVVDVTGFPPLQTILGWYVVPAAFKPDDAGFIYLDPERKPGLDAPLEEGNWRVTATVPNKSNPNAPYTLTWNFTVGGGTPGTPTPATGIEYVKPLGTTVNKKPTIMVCFTKGTTLSSSVQWVELFVDGQKINETNIYEHPATIEYTPAADMAEGTHTVLARLYDAATGETILAKEWTFELQTTNLGPNDGIMNIASTEGANKACTGCHGIVERKENTRFLHPLLNDANWTDSGCLHCHTWRTPWDRQMSGDNDAYTDVNKSYVYQSHPDPRVECTRCHGTNGDEINHSVMATHPTGGDCALCHKGDGTLVMIPDILNDSAMNMCTSCHYNVAPVNVTTNHNGAPEFTMSGRVSHNMDDGHLSDTKGCTSCHSRILTKEHARAGRTDKAGKAITCNTCHNPSYKNEKLALSGVSATLSKRTQVVQKIYYPPKGKRITSWISNMYTAGGTWRFYALIDGKWVSVNSYTMGYDNKVDGADALMIYGQLSRAGNRSVSATLDTPITVSITEVTLTTKESDKIWDAIVNGKSKCDDCHTGGHSENHSSSPAASCLECHKDNLVDEHMDNAATQSGNFYTCDTCHASNDVTIKGAITNHKRECRDCHGEIEHDQQHESGLDPNCQTCHKAILSKEHLNNSTTAGKNYNCDTCHTSTTKEVTRTISADSLYCAGCHQEGHNLLFADKVPADIPVYKGVYEDILWTTPMEAALFAGEPAAPVGYETGQVVISNRRADVTADEVWNFYKDQLTAGKWAIKSGVYVTGNQFFSAEYEKLGRSVTVLCFNTEGRDGTGLVANSGIRIEIWYK